MQINRWSVACARKPPSGSNPTGACRRPALAGLGPLAQRHLKGDCGSAGQGHLRGTERVDTAPGLLWGCARLPRDGLHTRRHSRKLLRDRWEADQFLPMRTCNWKE